MTQLAAQPRSSRGYTASTLHNDARELHTPRILFWNVGWLTVGAALALSVLGIVAIDTVPRPGEANYALRQIVFLCAGLVTTAIIAAPHYRWAQRISYPLMAVVLALLIFVLIPWVPDAIVRPRNGSRRWINLVVMDFQPSELAKVAYILVLATYLRSRSNYRSLIGLIWVLMLTFIPLGLVLKEPDLGTSLIFLPTLFAMLIAAGARMRHILLIVVLGLAAAPLTYPILEKHQKDRIDAMLAQIKGDDRYDDSIGYQAARAITLAGAGGVTGVNRDKAADLITYNHLPEDHNDMVFAVVCCRWGLLGAIATWGLFIVFCIGGMLTAATTRDPFGRLVAVGIVAAIFAQMTINTGMTIGLVPITGMTLPFVSYGGSSMLTAWMMVGLILSIAMRRSKYMARHSFEFDEAGEES